MKRISSSKVAMCLLGASMLSGAPALAGGPPGCSLATLQGSYGATINGWLSGLPYAEVDLVTSDGKGNVSGTGTRSYDGAIDAVTFTFTYTLTSACTGSAVFNDGVTQNFVITVDGSNVQFIATNDPSAQITGQAKRLY